MVVSAGKSLHLVDWLVVAEISGAEAIESDDGDRFVPGYIEVHYHARSHAHRTPGAWNRGRVVIKSAPGRLARSRTFGPSYAGLPSWADDFVFGNVPYRWRGSASRHTFTTDGGSS